MGYIWININEKKKQRKKKKEKKRKKKKKDRSFLDMSTHGSALYTYSSLALGFIWLFNFCLSTLSLPSNFYLYIYLSCQLASLIFFSVTNKVTIRWHRLLSSLILPLTVSLSFPISHPMSCIYMDLNLK